MLRIRQRRRLWRARGLLCQQAGQRFSGQRLRGVVDVVNTLLFFRHQQIDCRAAQRGLGCQVLQHQRQAARVLLQRGAVITRGVGQQLQRDIALFAEIDRNFQIAHRPGSQLMGDALNTCKIKAIIKHLQVDHRAIKRLTVANTTEIALHLFGVIALMTTQLFQTACQRGGKSAQRLAVIKLHGQRQDVNHRSGRAERRRSDAAHKDEAR